MDLLSLIISVTLDQISLNTQKINQITSLSLSLSPGQGFIPTSVLREILKELDNKLSNEELDGIIDEIDQDGSGTVDFDGECTQGGITTAQHMLLIGSCILEGLKGDCISSLFCYYFFFFTSCLSYSLSISLLLIGSCILEVVGSFKGD